MLAPDSRIDAVELHSGMEELRRRLEVLIGKKPVAPIDESERQRVGGAVVRLDEDRRRVAEAGGRMLAAAFEFFGGLLPGVGGGGEAGQDRVVDEARARLQRCVETDEEGR